MGRRDFTFRQLSSFVAAARSGSFAMAADQLGISQPAVSDHISALEHHLGHALFERRRGTTPKLTNKGIDMLHRAEALLRTSEAMRRAEGRMGTDARIRIRVSASPRLREVYLKPLLPSFYAENPNLEIELAPAVPLRDVATVIEKGDVDLMLCTVGRVPEDVSDVRLVLDVPVALVGAPELVDRVHSGWEAIENLPFVLPFNGVMADQWMEQQLAAVGIVPRTPIRYIAFSDVIQSMVESGFGVAILMREQVGEALAAGRLAELGPELPHMKQIVVRAPTAPHGTDILEKKLIRALGAVTA